jgi:hypothetical protein
MLARGLFRAVREDFRCVDGDTGRQEPYMVFMGTSESRDIMLSRPFRSGSPTPLRYVGSPASALRVSLAVVSPTPPAHRSHVSASDDPAFPEHTIVIGVFGAISACSVAPEGRESVFGGSGDLSLPFSGGDGVGR